MREPLYRSSLLLAMALLLASCTAPAPPTAPVTPGEPEVTAPGLDDGISGRYTFLHEISFYDPTAGDDWELMDATSCFSIHLLEDGSAELAGAMMFTNGHTCTVYGPAARVDENTFQQRLDDDLYPEPCELRIVFEEEVIRLLDDDGRCQRINCGARGHLDGAEFPRASREPGERCETF